MKLAMVAAPFSEENLTLLAQLGVRYGVHYNMYDSGEPLEVLRERSDLYARHGLRWVVSESGPPIGKIVLGDDGWEEQTEAYKRSLEFLGKAGVEVVAYNFMPQRGYDTMVVRTTYDKPTRGGARTSAFDLGKVEENSPVLLAPRIGRERMWDNLERFLRSILPAAEDAGIRMAMHPDDPPVLATLGLDRILSSVEDFERLLAISSSPSNGITLCIGCFAEMGANPVELVSRFEGRFPFIHIRNIAGTADKFEERFIDDGMIDIPELFTQLHRQGFDGYLRSDHTPVLISERTQAQEGYGMQGHIHAVGYIQGLIASVQRANPAWKPDVVAA
jgi:mannonate dehydratase